MSYTMLAVLAVVAAGLLDVVVVRSRLVGRSVFWRSYGVLALFQLLINGTLTGLPVVRYDSDTITGMRIAFAPIEDLAFGFALILVTLTLWSRATAGAAWTGASSGPVRAADSVDSVEAS